MRTFLLCATMLSCVVVAGASHAAVVTHTFDTNLADGSASVGPIVTFDDAAASGTVMMTIDLSPLNSPAFASSYWFNFSGAGTIPLSITRTGGTGPASSWITISAISADGYNSPGTNGLFDAMIGFESSNAGGGVRRFDFDEMLTFTLTGAGITAANFDVMSAIGGGGSGSTFGQFHIQGSGDAQVGVGGEGPGTGVPEPGALALLGFGLLVTAGTLRRRARKVRAR